MRFLFGIIIFALVLTQPAAVIPGDLPLTGAIAATATVAHPVGLIQLKADAEASSAPLITQYANRWFLYVPRDGASVMLDGMRLDVPSDSTGDIVSVVDLTALLDCRPVGQAVTITIIHTND